MILSKTEFLNKLSTDNEFNNTYGRTSLVKRTMILPPCHLLFQFWTRELRHDERLAVATKTLVLPDFTENIKLKEWLDAVNVPKRAISLQWYQRSVDTCLGLPTNLASYGLLLLMIANQVNMIPSKLIFVGGDTHLYNDHIEDAIIQAKRPSYRLPQIKLRDVKENIENYTFGDIIMQTEYLHHPQIKYKLSN